MDHNLLGKKVIIINPSEEHRWLQSLTGVIVDVDFKDYCYVVELHFSSGGPMKVRLVRGEFEEIPEK